MKAQRGLGGKTRRDELKGTVEGTGHIIVHFFILYDKKNKGISGFILKIIFFVSLLFFKGATNIYIFHCLFLEEKRKKEKIK